MQHHMNTGEAEYYALYDERSDGDWELQLVFSQYTVDDFDEIYETYCQGSEYLVVEGGDCDFPSILEWESLESLMDAKPTQVIGAVCTVKWFNVNVKDTFKAYFSFGANLSDEEPEKDRFGVPVENIFYYVSGVEELERLRKWGGNGDFRVLDYMLEYGVEE